MLKNNKFLIVFTLIIIFLLLFITNSFASYDFTTPDGVEYSCPDLPSDFTEDTIFLITTTGNGYYYILKFDSVPYDNKIYRYYDGKGTTLDSVNYYYYSSEGVIGTYDIYYNENHKNYISLATNRQNITSYDILYRLSLVYSSHFNVYNENNTIFFQKTPLQQTLQVVEITQVEEIPKAIAQTLKTIIPVGLVVLSIFLVIYLTKSVIFRQM